MSDDALVARRTKEQAAENVVQGLATGDVILMNRKCWSMKDPLSIGLCLCAKTASSFDHVGVVYRPNTEDLAGLPATRAAVDKAGRPSPSNTYIVEANVGGVTLRSMEERLLRTTSREVAVRPLVLPEEKRPQIETKMKDLIEVALSYQYKSSLMDFVAMSLKPPDKVDRMMAAKKMRVLYNEITLIQAKLAELNASLQQDDSMTTNMMQSEMERSRRLLLKLKHDYCNARSWLVKTYFPHLPVANVVDNELVIVDFDSKNLFFVDGENCGGVSKGVFCSELIVHLWQRSDILKRFPPATSFSPSDFDQWDDEFNFVDENFRMGPHTTLFPFPDGDGRIVRDVVPTSSTTSGLPEFMSERLAVLRHLYASVDLAFPKRWDSSSHETVSQILDAPSVLPTRWMLQSTTHYQLVKEMPERVVVIGVLFAFAGLVFSQQQLKSIERQLGLVTTRGGRWTLGLCFTSRSLLATAVQSWLTYRVLHQQRHNPSQGRQLDHTQVMRHNGPSLSSFADDRHPFYTASGLLIGCGSLACTATHVLERAALHWHFGPSRPSPPKLRLLLRGSLPSAFFFSFSYGGGWLIWYECFGPLYFTNETSVIRRCGSISDKREQRWIVQQRDAIVAAIGITIGVEALLYPAQTWSRRRFLRQVYAPETPPCRRASLYAGLGRHLARSLGICAVTVPVVWSWLL